MKVKTYQVFGTSIEMRSQNKCLIYKTNQGELFEYHNMSKTEEAKIEIFSRFTENLIVRKRISTQCQTCKEHNFSVTEKEISDFYDAKEVQRVNASLH